MQGIDNSGFDVNNRRDDTIRNRIESEKSLHVGRTEGLVYKILHDMPFVGHQSHLGARIALVDTEIHLFELSVES